MEKGSVRSSLHLELCRFGGNLSLCRIWASENASEVGLITEACAWPHGRGFIVSQRAGLVLSGDCNRCATAQELMRAL